IPARPEYRCYSGCQTHQCGTEAQRAANPIDQHGVPGTDTGLPHRGIGRTKIPKSCSGLEADSVRQLDERTLRCSHVFRKSAVRIGIEHRLRQRPAPEITLECEAAAV